MQVVWKELFWTVLVDSNGGRPWRHLVHHPLILTLLCLSEHESAFKYLAWLSVWEEFILCIIPSKIPITHCALSLGNGMCSHHTFSAMSSLGVLLNMYIFLSFPCNPRQTHTEKHIYVSTYIPVFSLFFLHMVFCIYCLSIAA